MDLTPAGSLNIDKDIQSIEDITALRTQLYSSLRSATGGHIYTLPTCRWTSSTALPTTATVTVR